MADLPEDEAVEAPCEEVDEDDAASTTSTTSNASSTGGKKKKKKTNRKKKTKANAEGAAGPETSLPTEASSSKPSISKSDAEKRFNAAMDSLRKGEDWIDLAGCGVPPAKAKKLFEALKDNASLTMLNLSNNQINDDAAQTLAGVLGMSGASGLLDLDLRDNLFTDTGLQVLDGLRKLRKEVVIHTGSLSEPEPVAAVAPPKPSTKGEAGGGPDVTKGKMFRKFFQTSDEDDESALVHEESQLDDRGINPTELWASIKEVVAGPPGDACVLALANKLQQLCLLLSRETMAIQSARSNPLDGSKPHIKECVSNLDALTEVLGLPPRPVTVQYASAPQPAVGSHRIAAAEAAALLLSPGNAALDSAVRAAGLAPRVVHLALAHPLCSSLHVRALRLFRSACASPDAGLAMALMLPGWGCGLQDPQEPAGGGEGSAGGAPVRPLPELLAAVVTPALGVPSGCRAPGVGFALEMARLWLPNDATGGGSGADDAGSSGGADTTAGSGALNPTLTTALLASSAWSEFCSDARDGGALRPLLDEQLGELCGPRPQRPPVEDAGDLANLSGGSMLSGREILALLQGMSSMGVMSS
uniref:Uncharacterized protein n=1 Tax=Chlamydomonas euryale TaxID=1486919 RepID=A0A7R9VAG8_9CHLO|mmetsp:Transcript_2516/g.6696  ORF Transcript_2516/g.6696 Transcript_2516/m.6696 type:complete len:587 (+) Transcript_2516:27-1787(+)